MELFAGIPWSQYLNEMGIDQTYGDEIIFGAILMSLSLRLLLLQIWTTETYPTERFGTIISSHLWALC